MIRPCAFLLLLLAAALWQRPAEASYDMWCEPSWQLVHRNLTECDNMAMLAPGNDTPELAGVDQLIGTFTTYHPCCAPRVTNIHRMAEIIDGTAIAPGKTFSLNDASGERTTAKGFVAAPAIVDGELRDQIGGGVSQFSTTLFNAAWFAGLDVIEHQPHSLYIPRYPPGREATLDWRAIDQVIRNFYHVEVMFNHQHRIAAVH